MYTNDTQAIKKAGKILKKTVYNSRIPIKTLRANYDAVLGTGILPNNIDLQPVDVGTVQAELLVPELAVGKRTILFAHGGGFVSGSCFSSRNLCASIAHESASRVLIPEYRLAPEYPFPTAMEDLYKAYAWLLRQNIAPKDILLAGDGAGANLILALSQHLGAERLPLPAAIIAISPWVNLSCDTTSYNARKNVDPIHSREILAALALQYTYQSNFTNPLVSPILGDYSFFPPLFIQCGSEEILVDDAKRLAQKAENAGVSVTLDIQEGMWHLFQTIDSLTPNAHLAIKKMGQWVRDGAQ